MLRERQRGQTGTVPTIPAAGPATSELLRLIHDRQIRFDGGGHRPLPRGRDPATVVHHQVYGGGVGRTNIDIDDDLVDRAMRMYRLQSKRAAVQLALEKLVGEPMSSEEVLAMQGVGYPLDNDELEGPEALVDLGAVDARRVR